MVSHAAIRWVRNNCPTCEVSRDVKRHIEAADAKGANCWFAVGGELTRSRAPFLVHCFGGEVFIFQLSRAQAFALNLRPDGMIAHREPSPRPILPSKPTSISLERFDVNNAVLSRSDPILGRLHYEVLDEVLADGNDLWCVALHYELPGRRTTAWNYPLCPLRGKGILDVRFPPIAPRPDEALSYRGPLALFARVFSMTSSQRDEGRLPISNICADLVTLT